MSFQIREFTEKDISNLLQLLNEANKGSYEFTPFDEEEIHFQVQERGTRILLAERKNEVLGVVAYRDGHWGEEIMWLSTSGTQDHRLIEDTLVCEIEKNVKREKVFAAVDADSPEINEWINRGYHEEGGLYHMIAPLKSKIPIPTIPASVILRSLKPGEEKELVEAVNAGFGWERLKSSVMQDWKADSPDFDENWVHVAELDNRIVSVVVAKSDVEHNKIFGTNRGYLGPAATLPEHRGKNLASALTARAMNFMFEKGFESAVLYTSDANVPSLTLLQKLGFRVGHHWRFMRKTIVKQN
jgi:ribosomal protein S18 acetylase RimI-like enzyme